MDVQEKEIRKMKKGELMILLIEAIDKINKINFSKEEVDNILKEIKEANLKINGDEQIKGFLNNIDNAYSEVYGIDGQSGKLKELRDAYNEIMIDNEGSENISLKSQIGSYIGYLEDRKKIIEELKKELFGYSHKKEDGTTEKIKGLSDKIKDLHLIQKEKGEELFENINKSHDQQKEEFRGLYEKIDERLEAGSTSVELAKVFSDKVKEYKSEVSFWKWLFITFIGGLILLAYIAQFFLNDITDWKQLLIYFLQHSPLFILAGWLLVFIGNRRAETKKLEEGYKHKEVMARSFIGYRKSIEELEGNVEEKDRTLMKKHMENLLETINNDSSKFLNSKGDNHPVFDLLKGVNNKVKIPEGLIEWLDYSIEIKKKK